MITTAWALLTSRLAGPVASGLALVLALMLLATCTAKSVGERTRDGRIASLAAEIDAPIVGWRARFADCRANVTTLDAAIEGQNASIAELKARGDAATARANEALRAARANSASAAADAARIMATPATDDLCASALGLMREP